MSHSNRERQRRSRRLVGFDYGGPGWFHVTLRTAEHAPPLAVITDGPLVLTSYGEMVAEEWRRAEELRPYLLVDGFVVMPDHLHGVLGIDASHPGRTAPGMMRSPVHTLGAVVRAFKTASTRRVNAWRGAPGAPLWQRSYYDRLIDTHAELEAVRAYIRANPARWRDDRDG